MAANSPPGAAAAAVLVPSEAVAAGTPRVRGYDFNAGVDRGALVASMLQTGFQATNLALAIEQVRRMVRF
jgi:deoxyhypusine synthase